MCEVAEMEKPCVVSVSRPASRQTYQCQDIFTKTKIRQKMGGSMDWLAPSIRWEIGDAHIPHCARRVRDSQLFEGGLNMKHHKYPEENTSSQKIGGKGKDLCRIVNLQLRTRFEVKCALATPSKPEYATSRMWKKISVPKKIAEGDENHKPTTVRTFHINIIFSKKS